MLPLIRLEIRDFRSQKPLFRIEPTRSQTPFRLTLTWRILSQAFFDSLHRDLQRQKISLDENQSIKNRL